MSDPKVGPADDETRRRAIEQHINEGKREKVGSRYPQRSQPSESSVSNGAPIEGQRRANAIDSVVDHAVRSLDPRPSHMPRP